MQTIRRIYLYAVSFVSLETILWGTIALARSFLTEDTPREGTELLARALSLILVGAPVFLIHGWLAHRSARIDVGERFSGVRALFLYGALLATLIPIAQNCLTLLNRITLDAFNLGARPTLFDGEQGLSENLIAIFINAIAAGAIYYLVNSDWKAGPTGDSYAEYRRLFRFLWLVYGAALVVSGIQQVLYFFFIFWQPEREPAWNALANGLSLLTVGLPLWILVQRLLNRSWAVPSESKSILRLVVLGTLTLLSAASALISTIFLVDILLNTASKHLLGVGLGSLADFLNSLATPFSVLLPFGIAWVYYARHLGWTLRPSAPEVDGTQPEKARNNKVQNLYSYALALFGLGVSFIGMHQLAGVIIELILGGELNDSVEGLSIALSNLLVGVPVWVKAWFPMQTEALIGGNEGETARRSTVRRGYLYLMLFTGVVGLMIAVGAVLYQLLLALLGEAPPDLLLDSLQHTKTTLLFAGLLAYHWQMLRGDGRRSDQVLSKRLAQFPILILAPDDEEFVTLLVEALRSQSQELPVAVHPISQGAPDEKLSAARAVILPAELAARPTEAMRLWLQTFDGTRLVLYTPTEGWFWLFDNAGSYPKIARQAAQAILSLAEGEELRQTKRLSPWLVLAYGFAAVFALQLVFAMVALIISLLENGL